MPITEITQGSSVLSGQSMMNRTQHLLINITVDRPAFLRFGAGVVDGATLEDAIVSSIFWLVADPAELMSVVGDGPSKATENMSNTFGTSTVLYEVVSHFSRGRRSRHSQTNLLQISHNQ